MGKDAYRKFQDLAEVFHTEGPGLLVHPVWKTERAYFAALEVVEEPMPDFVRYRFEFWEDWDGYDGGLKAVETETTGSAGGRTHTVGKGDTLWGIAKEYGVELAALIRANPQIKNPNLIHPGEVVRIP